MVRATCDLALLFNWVRLFTTSFFNPIKGIHYGTMVKKISKAYIHVRVKSNKGVKSNSLLCCGHSLCDENVIRIDRVSESSLILIIHVCWTYNAKLVKIRTFWLILNVNVDKANYTFYKSRFYHETKTNQQHLDV